MSDLAPPPPQSLADIAPDALRQEAEDGAVGDAWRIELDAYAGPLDLLLYLVKRHEIDLNNIPMAKLTAQYILHLKAISNMDVDRAAEFLVMASTLLEIKSRMILPEEDRKNDAGGANQAQAEDAGGQESSDPRLALVQQLLAYKKFKDAAWELERRQAEWENRFLVQARKGRAPIDTAELAKSVELDLDDLNVLDLQKAFESLIESIGYLGDHQVSYDDTPLAVHADDIADLMTRDAAESPEKAARGMTLRELFLGRKNRSEMIGLFIATLELVRNFIVRIVVDEGNLGSPDCVRLVLRPEAERLNDKQTNDIQKDWRDPHTGEMQYAWPDEETAKKAKRRLHLRAIVKARSEAEALGRKFDLKTWKKQQEALAKARGAADALADLDDVSEDDLLEEEGFASDKMPPPSGEMPMPEVPKVD